MTTHKVFFQNSSKMSNLKEGSVDLVVTSPPYPMIEMWDEIMASQNPEIGAALKNNPQFAFELMHLELDKVWNECYRLLKDGGFMCINIGDATRTIGGEFQLYNNHSRIVKHCIELGMVNLPNIIWRKQTNAPNKFMGSGMLPCGAYVTLEHEWILIFRKNGKRIYKKEIEKEERRRSAFFWEERNIWFSDIWDLKGVKQKISNSATRERSAAYPIEIPYRLINMYSQQNDTVLDPFLGLGTTSIAAMIAERNSIGLEIDTMLTTSIKENISTLSLNDMNKYIYTRFKKHNEFITNRINDGKDVKYYNDILSCKVMTRQEIEMSLNYLQSLKLSTDLNNLSFECLYTENTDMEKDLSLGELFDYQIR